MLVSHLVALTVTYVWTQPRTLWLLYVAISSAGLASTSGSTMIQTPPFLPSLALFASPRSLPLLLSLCMVGVALIASPTSQTLMSPRDLPQPPPIPLKVILLVATLQAMRMHMVMTALIHIGSSITITTNTTTTHNMISISTPLVDPPPRR